MSSQITLGSSLGATTTEAEKVDMIGEMDSDKGGSPLPGAVDERLPNEVLNNEVDDGDVDAARAAAADTPACMIVVAVAMAGGGVEVAGSRGGAGVGEGAPPLNSASAEVQIQIQAKQVINEVSLKGDFVSGSLVKVVSANI